MLDVVHDSQGPHHRDLKLLVKADKRKKQAFLICHCDLEAAGISLHRMIKEMYYTKIWVACRSCSKSIYKHFSELQ